MRVCRSQREADPTAEVWDTALSIGAIVEGQVHARKEYGVLCDLAAHPDVVGLVMPEQVIQCCHQRALASVQVRVLKAIVCWCQQVQRAEEQQTP